MKSKKHPSRVKHCTMIIFISTVLSGCAAAPYVVLALAPAALMIGASVYSAIEDADITANIHRDKRQAVKRIKKLAVLPSKRVASEYAQTIYTQTPHLPESMINSINTTLGNEGFEVIDVFEIEQHLRTKGAAAKTNQLGEEFFSTNDLIQGAFDLGADAVLLGTAVFGHEMKTSGYFGLGGSMQSNASVKSTNARLLGANGKTLMTLNLTYKNGQPPQEAGKALALVAAIKITNPDADVKAEAKARGAKG